MTTTKALTTTEAFGPQLKRLQTIGMALALIGAAVCVVGFLGNPAHFFECYLFAYIYWFSVTVGSLGLLMLHNMVGGGWGFVLRRMLEAGSRLLPLLLVLFVPVLLGLSYLYPWARPEAWSINSFPDDEVLRHKAPYLNGSFFAARAIFYFAVWMTFAYFINRWSAQQDKGDADGHLAHKLALISAGGIVAYALTMTFMAVDWVMSLEPHWVSSIFGLLTIVGQGLATFSLMEVLIAFLGGEREPVSQVSPRYFRDIGNLTLAFVLLWAYMSFGQYLITWAGNTKEEIAWYYVRAQGGWTLVGMMLIFLHFGLPFMVLVVSSGTKRSPVRLAKIAAFIMFMRWVDAFWLTAPQFHKTFGEALAGAWLNVAALAALGGIWLMAFAWQLKDRPVVPVHDPRLIGSWPPDLEEVAHHHG